MLYCHAAQFYHSPPVSAPDAMQHQPMLSTSSLERRGNTHSTLLTAVACCKVTVRQQSFNTWQSKKDGWNLQKALNHFSWNSQWIKFYKSSILNFEWRKKYLTEKPKSRADELLITVLWNHPCLCQQPLPATFWEIVQIISFLWLII